MPGIALTYCLFGDSDLYQRGMLHNIYRWKHVYPQYDLLLFHDDDAPQHILDTNLYHGGKNFNMSHHTGYTNAPSKMLWRYLPIDPDAGFNYDIILSRDADSRLTLREKWFTDNFINSPCLLGTLHDSPSHFGIMGGLTNVRCVFKGIKGLIDRWATTHDNNGHDQDFLNEVLRPACGDHVLTIKGNSIPIPYDGVSPGHCGCVDVPPKENT